VGLELLSLIYFVVT